MTGPAEQFLSLLERFNRKERFYLVGWALGKPKFELSDHFRESLSKKLNLAVPGNCFVAMDYHLDWIYAAAYLSSSEAPPLDKAICANPESDNAPGLKVIRGNQEDIDLVVAFTNGAKAHLLLIEAKGVTSWGNKQLDSKADRLKSIFGDEGTHKPYGHVQPHFVLVSPVESRGIQPAKWPAWMRGGKIAWLEMKVPNNLLAVTRCDHDGKVTRFGDRWKVEPERTFRVKAPALQSSEEITA